MSGTNFAVWSGPRNISTALMRSWENRPDCRVIDEPLYAYYLFQTGLDHPGREEVIAAGDISWEAVVAGLTAPCDGIYYQKHMAHHLIPQLPRDWIATLTNVILIRDPIEVVASYVARRTQVTAADLGLLQQVELFDQLNGEVPVIDSAEFLNNPEGYLQWLCAYIDVDFTELMLKWPAGPRNSDGVWAQYWYDAVISSTSFKPHRSQPNAVQGSAAEVVEVLQPHYERLRSGRIVL